MPYLSFLPPPANAQPESWVVRAHTATWQRRKPEETALYQVVQSEWATSQAQLEVGDRHVIPLLAFCTRGRWLGTSLLLALSTSLTGQCALDWIDGPSAGGPERSIYSLTSLTNGDLIAVDSFRVAGTAITRGVSRWDGTQWSGLGTGLANQGFAAVELNNGDIVVGGYFTSAGGTPANNVARWDGSEWTPLGSGFNGAVRALLVTNGGDLIAGGSFSQSGQEVVHRVARWDGARWVSMGLGLLGGATAVMTLAELTKNDD